MKRMRVKEIEFGEIKLRTASKYRRSYSDKNELNKHYHGAFNGYLRVKEKMSIPCDNLIFCEDGGLYVKGNGKHRSKKIFLYESCFYQLLKFLEIPVQFAKSISIDLLSVIINSLLSQKYDKTLHIRYVIHEDKSFNNTIYGIGLTPKFTNKITSHEIFAHLATRQFRQICSTVLIGSRVDGFNISTNYSFHKLGKNFCGFEVHCSEGLDIKPSISPFIQIQNCHIMFKSATYYVTSPADKSPEQIMKTITSSVVKTFHYLKEMLSDKGRLKDRELSQEDLLEIRLKSSKMMSSQISGESSTVFGILKEVSDLQAKAISWDLNEFRRCAFFAGWLVENF